jgi:hypothetical protein
MIAAAAFLTSSWPSLAFDSARLLSAERMAAKMLMEMASGLDTVNVEPDEADCEAV